MGKCSAFENDSSQASEVFKASSVLGIFPACCVYVCLSLHLCAIPNKSPSPLGKDSAS